MTNVMQEVFHAEHIEDGLAREFLYSKGWPAGFQNFLIENVAKMPYRFFICDDSGSMASNDGHKIVESGGLRTIQSCSRWTELAETLKYLAQMAEALQSPSEFRFLNGPTIVIGKGDNQGMPKLLSSLENMSGGGTPLCRQIGAVVQQLKGMEASLRSTGQKAAVIIATDGEASDGDVAKALAPLHLLPVWVVIRLCTDEERIVEYWNGIDQEIELEMDVIDDLVGESKEIYKFNPWLNYAEPVHRMREFGIHLKEFDMLDENLISADQMRKVVSILFSKPISEIPHPVSELKAFNDKVRILNAELKPTWNPAVGRVKDWVDPAQVTRCYGPKTCGCCVVM